VTVIAKVRVVHHFRLHQRLFDGKRKRETEKTTVVTKHVVNIITNMKTQLINNAWRDEGKVGGVGSKFKT